MKKKIKKKENKLKTVWFFLRKYKIYFIFMVGLAVLAGILESINVGLMYPIINNILGAEGGKNFFISFIDNYTKILPIDDELIRYSVLFIFIAIFTFIVKTVYYYLSVKFTSKIVKETKQEVFNKCITSDYQFFVDNKQGEILYKISHAPNSIAKTLQILSDMFIYIFLSVSIIGVLFSMSWKLVMIMLLGGIIYFYLIRYISAAISYKAGRKKRESGQEERVIVTEYTSGIKQIKVFETYGYWRGMFDKALDTFWFHHRRNYFWKKFPEILLWMVIYLSIGGAIIAIKLQYPGRFMYFLPLIGTFATGIFLILPKIAIFGKYRMEFVHELPNIETVYDLLKDKSYTKIKNGAKHFKGLEKGLFMKNVTFSHKERDILLDNINLEIKKDQTTALVGPSGSGKSTIVNLLLRLYDVEKGGVYVDDTDIREYDIFSYLDKVGFVSQDTFVFNGTIRDNIAFGNEYSEEEIIKSAKMANADEFINKLPKGYDTLVGDRGMRLSGGEKQRIAIARAMIRKPEILILDEATSSLDNISESVVQKAIDKVSKSCTTFIIAHRLSTIKNADVINVLDDGKITERGTHEELLKKKGKYWGLHKIQNK